MQRLLALGLYRSGRQGDALAALRRARTILSDELGIDPGPALRKLESDIKYYQGKANELSEIIDLFILSNTSPKVPNVDELTDAVTRIGTFLDGYAQH